MRLGVGFTPFETRVETIVHLAERADHLGFDRVEVAEGWTHDALIVLAELALRTSTIGLGTGIISAWGRTPATIALAATGLQRCSGGRFSLGIGASSPPLVEGLHGVPWDRPVDRLRQTLTAVRALLAGDRLPDPAPGARALRLGVRPDAPIPIGLAALSPPSIRLAGELADTWAPFLWARSRVSQGRALLDAGEARAAVPTPTRVAVGIPVALASDAAGARRLAAWWLSTYLTRMGPLYPTMLRTRFAMESGVDALLTAADGGIASALPAAADELAGEVTLFGSFDQVGDLLAAWSSAGADSLHLVLPPGHPEDELMEILEVVAAAHARRTATARDGRSEVAGR